MSVFYIFEIIQFLVGLSIVIISYRLIAKHREPLIDSVFGDNIKMSNSFETLTSVGYFLIFIPILLVGVNLEPPAGQKATGHLQRIIYFEAGLVFLIGILHLGMTIIFSTVSKKPQSKTKEE